MVPAVRPLGPLSMARGCARIDSRPDTAKIGSADRVEVHHARLLAVIGVRKTFPHGLGHQRKSVPASLRSALPPEADIQTSLQSHLGGKMPGDHRKTRAISRHAGLLSNAAL